MRRHLQSFCFFVFLVQNSFVLVVTVLKKPEYLGPPRDALNVCAVTKEGAVFISKLNALKVGGI